MKAVAAIKKYMESEPHGRNRMCADALGVKFEAHEATAVSDYTRRIAGVDEYHLGDVRREHAVEVIDQAIRAIEAQQRADRLAVLEQARSVVDSAHVEPVTA